MSNIGNVTFGDTIYLYEETDASSVAIGIDSDDQIFKLSTSLSVDGSTLPSTNPNFMIDTAANGHVTVSPNGTGHLVLTNGTLDLPSSSGLISGNITIQGFPYLRAGDSGVPNNTFLGQNAGNNTVSGVVNVGIGTNSSISLTTGFNNTAIGSQSLENVTTGRDNIGVGKSAGTGITTNNFNIAIGNPSNGTDANTIRIGTNGNQNLCYITGIEGVDVGSVAKIVTVDADQLGSATITAGTGITVTPSANTITIAATGSSSNAIVTTYHVADSPATFTPNAATKYITVYGWAGGNGGGSGRKGTTATAGGGSGGNGGAAFIYSAPIAYISSPTTVVIGAGGAGGAAQTTDATNGNPGTEGGKTSFGNMEASNSAFSVNGATTSSISSKGLGGVTGSVATSGFPILTINGLVTSNGPTGGNGSNTTGTNGASGNTTSKMQGGSGGGGGGANSVVEQTGGYGSASYNASGSIYVLAGLPGLESTGINGGNGNSGTFAGGIMYGGTGGGGGGGYSVGAGGATAGGNGGNGGFPGGSGGGGGGGISTVANSGAGGNGADGLVIIVEFL